MKRLALSISGGILVGVITSCSLGLVALAAGSVVGLSFSFHAGISPLWLVVFPAVLLGSGIAASWSAARLCGRHSWSAPLGASIGLAMVMALPFLWGHSPKLVGMGLTVAVFLMLVPGVIVASLSNAASSNDGSRNGPASRENRDHDAR